MNQRAVHIWVSGQVQGVFYRHATKQQALELGITGWVHNLADGRVELIACGSVEAIDKLIAWLYQGPPRAKVSAVEIHEAEDAFYDDFSIKR